MQLVQLVSVDLQDITDTHEALLHGAFDRAAELDEITAWLAGHHTDHPGLATELTALLETAAAALRDQATR